MKRTVETVLAAARFTIRDPYISVFNHETLRLKEALKCKIVFLM